MIEAKQFDVKTGKPVQVVLEGRQQPAIKQIEHSYLEHWCQTHNIDTDGRFSVARFYESVHDSDRKQLESEGKYLVFSHGSEGYFTDFETAKLMTVGSETVAPIYADDRNSPHNAVAYGGLIASDGVASTMLPAARILVIDNVGRTHGTEVLTDWRGQSVSTEDLQDLYDKMGDGTMLVRASTMDSLITPEERNQTTVKAFEKVGISGDMASLGEDIDQMDRMGDTAIATIDRSLRYQADTSVYQFRAASPDLPGIAKGTMTYSSWAERLKVDAIISTDDIKGDDGRFSKPGIQEVSSFWMNRKATAKYGQQTVGPQVKYNIPETTQHEINPRVREKAEALAQVAGDYDKLSQRYLKHKESERNRPYQGEEEETFARSRPDWLYNTLSSDKYAQLTDQANVVRGLEYYIQGEWQRLSANGTSVPSAMAQHHSKLKPWEVCNKDILHGAVVAYYRSPFPNVGAAAIAINNTEILREQDSEAFSKQGVVYLPPDTAKNVAITDFDGDVNGFFVGYLATVDDLPQQLRAELASTEGQLPARQYEAGRATIEAMIHRLEQGQDSRIKASPSQYPMAVKEFAERTRPEVRPPQIKKQDKEEHPWEEGESHTAATWRAWGITADNPTGKVANAAMTLQSLALELKYAPDYEKGALLQQVSSHYSNLLAKANAGKIVIPDDKWLAEQGFSSSYQERLEALAGSSEKLHKYTDPQHKKKFIDFSLRRASLLLSEVAVGPNAVNLQTAVDTAKSARGIDTDLHEFVQALQYKRDDFRRNKNNPLVYTNGEKMPTSVNEPVSWGVEIVNEQYGGARLQERSHEAFQGLFPKVADKQQTWQATAILKTSSALTDLAVKSKTRHRKRRPEDQKPTVRVKLADGRQLAFQNIPDAEGTFPWRSEGARPDWSIEISKTYATTMSGKRFPAKLRYVDDKGKAQTQSLGYLTKVSIEEHGLEEKFQQSSGRPLTITGPRVKTQVPWAQENDPKTIYEQRERYLEQVLAPPVGKDPQVHSQEMATALWRQPSIGGRKLMMQQYPDILSDRLQAIPELVVMRLQVSSAEKQQLVEQEVHTIQFGLDEFSSKEGPVVKPSVSVLTPEGKKLVGAVYERNMALPEGATYMAVMSALKSEKAIGVQIMDLPAVEQTPTEMSALKEGRRHLTFDYEPHAVYGVREGDIVLAQAEEGGEQIALRVGDQHRIDEKLLAKPGAAQRWAEAEKSEQSALFQQLSTATGQGKTLMGLNVEVLGTYERGQIEPFEQSVVEAQPTETVVSVAPLSVEAQPATTVESVSSQSQTASLSAEQLWEGYSQIKGELEALPQLHSSLDWAMASKAIAAGHSPELVQQAIALYSPEAQRSQEPEKYAQEMVDRVDAFVEPVPAQATPSAPSGVMAALARSNPAMKQRLEQAAKELAAEKQPKPAADKQKGKSVGKKQSPARSRSQSRTRSPKKDKGADMGY